MDYLVRKCREVKANREEFPCRIALHHFESMDKNNEGLLLAKIDYYGMQTNSTGKPQPIAKEIVNTFN